MTKVDSWDGGGGDLDDDHYVYADGTTVSIVRFNLSKRILLTTVVDDEYGREDYGILE